MKKAIAIVFLVIVGLLLQVVPLWALGEIKDAKGNLDMGYFENAFQILDEYIRENPTNLEANLQFGRYHLLKGYDRTAIKIFGKILQINARFKADVGKIFQEAADMESKKDFVNCSRWHKLLMHAYDFNPHLDIDAEKTLAQYGDIARSKNQLACAEKFYALSEKYGKKNIRTMIAHRRLHLAALGHKPENMKAKAEPIVGSDFVKKVLPGIQTVTVFEKTYSDKNTNAQGTVRTFCFGTDDVRVGDKMEIIGTINDGEYNTHEILVYQCKTCKPKWKQTTKGYMSEPVPSMDNGAFFSINIPKGFGISAKVLVIREVYQKPRIDLLDKL